MKRLKLFLIYCIAIPVCMWVLLFMIGAQLPEKKEEIGLTIPRATPREGYEVIFPLTYNGKPDRDTFYYVSDKRQVVYRYDEDRYLELQGENCEGLIWYHDDKNNIHTRIDKFYFNRYRLPTFKYFNPGKDYIGIPSDNLSSVMFSLDGGRSFYEGKVTSYAAVPGEQVDRFIGVDDTPLTLRYHDVDKGMRRIEANVTISGNTGYFVLKNNSVIFGETVFYNITRSLDNLNEEKANISRADYHSLSSITTDFEIGDNLGAYDEIYRDPIYLERIANARNIKIEPYQGWDRIRCEIGAEK